MKKYLFITLLFVVGIPCAGLSQSKTITIKNGEVDYDNPGQISETQQADMIEGLATDSNPCGLKEVICENEGLAENGVQNHYSDTNSSVGVISASNDTLKQGNFSMYTSSIEETDDSPFITADGTDLRKIKGCVVANNTLKFGTTIRIPDLGIECVVHDRMNKRYGEGHFDIHTHESRQYALKFGRKILAYEVIE